MPVLLAEFHKSLKLSRYSHSMKLANITPVFKKNDQTEKSNYRPVSRLLNLSKVFKRCIYYQHILMGYFLNNNVDLERVSMETQFRLRFSFCYFFNWPFKDFWQSFPRTISNKINCLWSRYLSSFFYLWLFN